MKNKLIIVGLILLFLITIVLSGCSSTKTGKEIENIAEIVEVVEEETEPAGIYNPLTGNYVEKTQNITAVMIDNLGPARPQSGLINADIIYEIEAEGLITRIMALFYGDPPEFVGPVRSARPYFMQLALEWDAYYAHVGGCNDSFAKVKEWKVRDMDDTRGHKGFYVDSTRKRPHSTYLNFEEALKGKADNGKFKEWSFMDLPDEEPDYQEISFSYSRNNNVKYKWDENKKQYLRYINNNPFEDRESGEQISVSNIIIQYATHRSLQTELKHIWVDVVGAGKAEYFIGGQYIEGTWEKKSRTEPTKFYDVNGNPITLAKGQTWIQIVRPNMEISKI